MTAIKLSGCGSLVRVDTGGGFTTHGLIDSLTPWNQSKTIIDTPTLDCVASSEVGREEQSVMSFTRYWDPQDADQLEITTNFEDSISDATLKDVQVQIVTDAYITGGGAAPAKTVTYEATCQIASITPGEITPDGHWKQTITCVRTSTISRTVA